MGCQYSDRGWIQSLLELDLTPTAFTLSGLLIAYALFRHGLLDLVPVARSKLIESMTDGVLVIDFHNRIVDINLAARQFLNLPEARVNRRASRLGPGELGRPDCCLPGCTRGQESDSDRTWQSTRPGFENQPITRPDGCSCKAG